MKPPGQLRGRPRTAPLDEDGNIVWSSLTRHQGLRNGPRLALVSGGGAPVVEIKRQRRKDTGPSPAVRNLVLERDGYRCVCCGVSVIGLPYSLQHRKRRSQGGDNSPSNLITVLGTGTTGCHERIDSRRDPEDEAKGYTVRSWDDPALIPVMIFSEHGSGISAYLLPDGQYAYEPPEGAA